jgi:hypothetical protein
MCGALGWQTCLCTVVYLPGARSYHAANCRAAFRRQAFRRRAGTTTNESMGRLRAEPRKATCCKRWYKPESEYTSTRMNIVIDDDLKKLDRTAWQRTVGYRRAAMSHCTAIGISIAEHLGLRVVA